MKVYLAAQYPRRDEMRYVAKLFLEHNIEVTSRWLYETDSLNSQLPDNPPYSHRECATTDIADIKAADTLVLFSENPLIGVPRGGRHTEFGFALGSGKRVVVIGGAENNFHYLPEVVHYSDVDSFLEAEGISNEPVAD